jgi:hypothetical protein
MFFSAFWIRIRSRNLFVRNPDPSINKQKNEEKPWFLLFSDFKKGISLKIVFCCRLEYHRGKEQDPAPDQDPLVKGADQRIRIQILTKMSHGLKGKI